MNVILNTEEVNVVLTLVTSQVLDHVELSDEAREGIRRWRREHALGSGDLDDFSDVLNEAVGNYINERTTRMMRKRGKRKEAVTGVDL